MLGMRGTYFETLKLKLELTTLRNKSDDWTCRIWRNSVCTLLNELKLSSDDHLLRPVGIGHLCIYFSVVSIEFLLLQVHVTAKKLKPFSEPYSSLEQRSLRTTKEFRVLICLKK